MKCRSFIVLFVISLLASNGELVQGDSSAQQKTGIFISSQADFHEQLAAKEIRRYIYLRTEKYLTIETSEVIPADENVILLANKNRPILKKLISALM